MREFNSFAQFELFKSEYEKQRKQYYVKGTGCDKLKENIPIELREQFKYQRVNFVCKFGNNTHKTNASERKRISKYV